MLINSTKLKKMLRKRINQNDNIQMMAANFGLEVAISIIEILEKYSKEK